MNLNFYNLLGYHPKTYRAYATLTGEERSIYDIFPIQFILPNLPHWSISYTPNYQTPVALPNGELELRGAFIEGIWFSDMHIVDVAEYELSPSTVEIINALKNSIKNALELVHKWNDSTFCFNNS